LQAIDIVTIDFKDIDSLQVNPNRCRLGFTGKADHPSAQVEPVQTAFTPDDSVIAHAQQIVETFEASQARGAGGVCARRQK